MFGATSEIDLSPLVLPSCATKATIEDITLCFENSSLLTALVQIHRQTLKSVKYIVHPGRMSPRLCETLCSLTKSCTLDLIVLCPHHTARSLSCNEACDAVVLNLVSFDGKLSTLCCECDAQAYRANWGLM